MRKCGGVSNLATAEWGNDGFRRLNNSHRVLGHVAALSGNASSGTGCYTAVEDQTETFGKSDRRRCRILGLGNATPPSVPPAHPRLMPPVYSRFRSPGHNSVAAATYCFPMQPILRRNTPQMMRPWRRLLIPRSRALDRLKATHLHLSATLPSLAEVRVSWRRQWCKSGEDSVSARLSRAPSCVPPESSTPKTEPPNNNHAQSRTTSYPLTK